MKRDLPSPHQFVSYSVLKYCLGSVLILVFAMATVSNYNRHPDESNHLSAAGYYTNHFLPPEIGDPAVRNSYSVWGISYLNYQWVEYFLAGKFISMVSPLIRDPDLAARFFNCSLLVLLAVIFYYRSRTDNTEFIIPCFLLVTPQIWYVFSYCNNDAFAVFVSILLAYEIASQQSSLSEYLRSKGVLPGLTGGVFAGLLFGLLIICKTNYWLFLFFAASWLFLNFPLNALATKKYAIIALVALSVFAFRIGLDFYVNGETDFSGSSYMNYFLGGFETKPGKLLAYQDEIADYEFKPTTLENELERSRPEVKLKAKGTPAIEMLSKWHWHTLSFESFVGLYGYMNLSGPKWYYGAMLLLFFSFGLYVVVAIIARRDRESLRNFALAITGFLLATAISFYLSWNYAFQPQGRYLFPVIPILATFVYSYREFLNPRVINSFLIAVFILSVYSFVFVGLAQINNG